ncbi:hypothetical protein CDCA_CDCA05G1514 [Cyanidium caldarium]|uniref:PSD13 N-terminal domain-containing protein n=1 Tax=Cyanidium caldarium TaxID=2771 RepID=A0AAV9ITK5_CYACA|nr:hypothetical protein CDCA_CDCA05G1514 [Cyanidium caldarium]
MNRPAREYIQSRAQEDPQRYSVLAELYEKRLWHQLTQQLVSWLEAWRSAPGGSPTAPLELYECFVRDFETRLNALSLTQIVVAICRLAFGEDAVGAVGFLRSALEGKAQVESSAAARIMFQSEVVCLLLRAGTAEGVTEAKERLQRAGEWLDAAGSVDLSVSSAYYRSASEYYKRAGPASAFYRSALAFLSCTPFDALAPEEQVQWALDVGLAALLGKDIFNFGEVLQHEVVRSLTHLAEHQWLYRMLQAFYEGDIRGYQRLCREHAARMQQYPALASNAELLTHKITLLRLTRLAMQGDAQQQHQIFFETAARECLVSEEEMEHVAMAAFSKGLAHGWIDQVGRTITITRLQPQVMDQAGAAEMARRLAAWEQSADRVLQYVETAAGELLATAS